MYDDDDYEYASRIRHNDQTKITALLCGHKVTKVNDTTLELDNGTVLKLRGNKGGCSCSAGDYRLIELNGADNVITKVEFDYDPSRDEYDGLRRRRPGQSGQGFYRIFVYADNQKINLATFKGHDGNGHYGTGFSIEVEVPA